MSFMYCNSIGYPWAIHRETRLCNQRACRQKVPRDTKVDRPERAGSSSKRGYMLSFLATISWRITYCKKHWQIKRLHSTADIIEADIWRDIRPSGSSQWRRHLNVKVELFSWWSNLLSEVWHLHGRSRSIEQQNPAFLGHVESWQRTTDPIVFLCRIWQNSVSIRQELGSAKDSDQLTDLPTTHDAFDGVYVVPLQHLAIQTFSRSRFQEHQTALRTRPDLGALSCRVMAVQRLILRLPLQSVGS